MENSFPTWQSLQSTDWVQSLKGTPQDPIYHAEGDVWIHTGMVLEALCALPAYQNLPLADQKTLFLATAMHDIAKPVCTTHEANGRIRSRKHALVGRLMARLVIYQDMEMGFAEREAIAQLVRYHGLPIWALEKPDAQEQVLRASQLCNLQWLALLAEADVRGRTCEDQAEMLDRVDLFREYCRELNVWEQAYPFENGAHRFHYFQNPESGPLYVPYDNYTCEVTLVCGMPGSGKSTWAKAQGLPMISLDEIRSDLGISPKETQGKVINTAKEQARVFLRAKKDFIWDATNLGRDVRKQLIDLFTDYRAKVHLVYVETGYQEMRERNRGRKDVVPAKVMLKMLKRLEVPEVQEAHRVTWLVNGQKT